MPHSIFVVEDDARLSGLLVRRLREAGFVADCAADGLRAWTTIRPARPDPVLVDIELPELDGLQLCKRLSWARARWMFTWRVFVRSSGRKPIAW